MIKLGFHGGPGGNHEGIGEFYRRLAAAGKPVNMKSVDHGGHIFESQSYGDTGGFLNFRLHSKGLDLPIYDLTPKDAAVQYWNQYKALLPPELDYSRVILGILNEPAKWFGGPDPDAIEWAVKHRQPAVKRGEEWIVDNCPWLARFCIQIALFAMAEGYKVGFFGWSTGEPEPFQWESEDMLALLALCGKYPDRLFIDLHEYSLSNKKLFDPNDMSMVGRFLNVRETCERFGMPTPSIIISEFGWQAKTAPTASVAMDHLRPAMDFYNQYPEVKALYLWCLNVWNGNVNDRIQSLIKPVGDAILNSETVVVPDPPPPVDTLTYSEEFDGILIAEAGTDGRVFVPADLMFSATRGEEPIAQRDEKGYFIKSNSPVKIEFSKIFNLKSGVEYQMSVDLSVSSAAGGVSVQLTGNGESFKAGTLNEAKQAVVHHFTPDATGPVSVSWQIEIDNNATFIRLFNFYLSEDHMTGKTDGSPRVNYARKYYLMPPDVGADWPKAVIDALWTKERPTVGASADDAGIGAITNKTAVIVNPEAWGDDIVKFYKVNYPQTKIETLTAETPADLFKLLNGDQSVDDDQSADITLEVWPTGRFTWITQGFGWNPASYAKYGLPGHNGVDIGANEGSEVFAATDGRVVWFSPNNTSGNPSAYGWHMRIETDEYVFIYAHLKPGAYVKVGQVVEAGDLIARIGNKETPAENSTGPHLHFEARRRDGVGFENYPWGIIDVGPMLYKLRADPKLLPRSPVQPSPDRADTLLGVHASADSYNMPGDIAKLSDINPGIMKVLSSHNPSDVRAMVSATPAAKTWVIRAFLDFSDGRKHTPQDFYRYTESDVRRTRDVLIGAGIRSTDIYIEIHNEPNLVAEGYGTSWRNGREFGAWFEEAFGYFKAAFQGSPVGFPAVSPGHAFGGRPMDSGTFMSQAASYVRRADWLAVHAYWSSSVEYQYDTVSNPSNGVGVVQAMSHYGKPMIVTEASNNKPANLKDKADQYVKFVNLCRAYNCIGVTYFVLSASNGEWMKSGEIITPTFAELLGEQKTNG